MKREPKNITPLLQRLAALPYNRFFISDIHELRNKYHIPCDSRAAESRTEYFKLLRERQIRLDYIEENKRLRQSFLDGEYSPAGHFRTIERYIEDIDHSIESWSDSIKEIELLIIEQKNSNGPTNVEIVNQNTFDFHKIVGGDIDVAMSFYEDLDILLDRHSLPHSCWGIIEPLIITDDYEAFIAKLSEPKVEICTFPPSPKTAIEYPITHISISALLPYLTKKQWDNIWYGHVSCYSNVKKSRKRATLKAYYEQMKRWSEWYHLSQLEGNGPTKALEIWEDSNPDKKGKYDQSTVTKAIQEFKEIITPKD